MAQQPGYDPQTRGEMDYPEHERTYARFLGLVKYGTIAVIGIVLFMAVALVGGGGIIGGIVIAAIFVAVASFMMASGDARSMKH